MKKVFMVLASLATICGCNFSDAASETEVKKALSIIRNELGGEYTDWTGDMNFNDMHSLSVIKDYLASAVFEDSVKNMQCKSLDGSDVKGKKSIRGCLLKNINSSESTNKDVLVLAKRDSNNKRVISLTFFDNAKRTENGFSYTYNQFFSVHVAVNLDTQKVGSI